MNETIHFSLLEMWITNLGDGDMKIYCCLEHTDLALDIIVDECEVAPEMTKIESSPQVKCEYCGENAEYIVEESRI